MINPFLNSERQLRDGRWALTFFLVLAACVVPTIILAQKNSVEFSIDTQASIGRALALCAYGTLQAIEFDEQDRLDDAPAEKKKNAN